MKIDVFITFGLRFLAVCAGLLLNILSLEYLGLEDFGIVSITLLTVNVGATIIRLGLDQTLIRKINQQSVEQSLEISLTLMHAIVFSLPVIFCIPLVHIFVEQNLVIFGIISLILVLMLSYTIILSEALKGQNRVNMAIFLQNLLPMLFPLLYIFLVEQGDVTGILAAYLFGYILIFPILIVQNRVHFVDFSKLSPYNAFVETSFAGMSQMTYMSGHLLLNYAFLLNLTGADYGKLAFLQRFIGVANIMMGVINSITAKNIAHLVNSEGRKKLNLYIHKITKLTLLLGTTSSIFIYIILNFLDHFYFTTVSYSAGEINLAILILFFAISLGPTTNISVLSDNSKYSVLAAVVCYSICFIIITSVELRNLYLVLGVLILEVILYKGIQIVLLNSKARIQAHFVLGLIK